ncbi:hypothetical protein GLYMA_19G045300v4 [Glycine max]|uniref:Uncharacterized protein n=1 Tax=Glycine max TaxID=3847 RepID=K7MWJ2_SOYBN|nr:hypothetical protein GYH30_052045 [Glycine max]KRG93839.1 hypothetical protein GLYMA_19G045300v4 [Glycine max]
MYNPSNFYFLFQLFEFSSPVRRSKISFLYLQIPFSFLIKEVYMHMQIPEAALIFLLSFSVEINIPGSLDVLKCTCVVHR